MMSRVWDERGAALILVLITLLFIMALGAGLVLITATETAIAANFRIGHEAVFAAEAALERTIAELSTTPDWDAWLAGVTSSSFTDGAPPGRRTLADGSSIDLAEVTNQANCQKRTSCSAADLDTKTTDRPWGANNPRWSLAAYGPLRSVSPGIRIDSPFYVVAFVADDGAENDGDAARDGVSIGGVANPGAGVIAVRAEAFGPHNAHRVIEARIARNDPSTVRLVAWEEVR